MKMQLNEKQKKVKVTGWLAKKLKKEGGDIKMKTTKEYDTPQEVKRAMIAGLFRSMKAQGKNIGKMTGESETNDVANSLIERVVAGEDAFDVLSDAMFDQQDVTITQEDIDNLDEDDLEEIFKVMKAKKKNNNNNNDDDEE